MIVSPSEQVRRAAAMVSEKAAHVRIAIDRIPSYAALLPPEQVMFPELDPGRHYLGHGEDTTAFFITLNTVNFGSGYSPHLRKRPGMSGYFTVASSLNDHFMKYGPFSADRLASITPEECSQIFGQDPANGPIAELMRLFATAWNDLGRYLLDRFDASFSALVENASSSAGRLIQLLIEMPFFNDVESYGSIEVPFYKRAQLMAADLQLAFAGQGPGYFEDIDRLTIFADNLVPHVLRVDGILVYEEELATRIDSQELIPAGSSQEIEIRACAVHAVEMLVEEMGRLGRGVTSRELDYLLWNRGQHPYYKARPRHRTRTVYY